MDSQAGPATDEFDEHSRIITAKYFFAESEARLYAAYLREAGIPSYISNANIMTALPLGGGGGIGLHVREEDLVETSRIIARLDYQKDSEPEPLGDAGLEDIQYLQALSTSSAVKQAWSWWQWAVLFIASLLVLRAFLRAAGWVESWWDFF